MAYISLADLSNEGMVVSSAGDKTRAEKLIRVACAYFDKMTGQWFDDRSFTADAPLLLDGSGTRTLHLPVPIISVTDIKINGTAINMSGVAVYNRRVPDDRGNPRIVFKLDADYLEAAWFDGSLWPVGRQNIALVGHFGYMDWGDEGQRITPEPVKQAVLKMVMREMPKLGTGDGMMKRKLTDAKSETTDDHSYTLFDVASSGTVTGDPEIDNVIAAYRAPLICEAL